MINRILSLVGWLGAALVFIGAAIRFGYPALGAVRALSRVDRPGGRPRVHGRDNGASSRTRSGGRQARYGTLAGVSVLVVLGILVAVNYIGARQNKRWDLTANKAFSLSDQSRNVLTEARRPAADHGLRRRSRTFPRYQDKLKEYEYISKQVTTEYIDPDKKPDRRQAEPGPAVRHDPLQLQGPHRAGDVRRRRHRTGHHQRHHQGGERPAAEGLLRPGPRRARHRVAGSATATARSPRRSAAKTTWSRSSCSRRPGRCPTMRRW